MLSPKIFTNLLIIVYILKLDFQLVGGNVYLHIGQIMHGSLSLTRGDCGRGKIAFVLVVVPVVFSSRYRFTISYQKTLGPDTFRISEWKIFCVDINVFYIKHYRGLGGSVVECSAHVASLHLNPGSYFLCYR